MGALPAEDEGGRRAAGSRSHTRNLPPAPVPNSTFTGAPRMTRSPSLPRPLGGEAQVHPVLSLDPNSASLDQCSAISGEPPELPCASPALPTPPLPVPPGGASHAKHQGLGPDQDQPQGRACRRDKGQRQTRSKPWSNRLSLSQVTASLRGSPSQGQAEPPHCIAASLWLMTSDTPGISSKERVVVWAQRLVQRGAILPLPDAVLAISPSVPLNQNVLCVDNTLQLLPFVVLIDL